MSIKKSSLEQINRNITFGQQEKMPFAQGYAINEVIKKYKIPAKAWGYHGSHIGIETNKQKIFWKDEGTHLTFLGILNK